MSYVRGKFTTSNERGKKTKQKALKFQATKAFYSIPKGDGNEERRKE